MVVAAEQKLGEIWVGSCLLGHVYYTLEPNLPCISIPLILSHSDTIVVLCFNNSQSVTSETGC